MRLVRCWLLLPCLPHLLGPPRRSLRFSRLPYSSVEVGGGCVISGGFRQRRPSSVRRLCIIEEEGSKASKAIIIQTKQPRKHTSHTRTHYRHTLLQCTRRTLAVV